MGRFSNRAHNSLIGLIRSDPKRLLEGAAYGKTYGYARYIAELGVRRARRRSSDRRIIAINDAA